MDVDLLHRHGIDPARLPSAPADPSRAAWRFRLNVSPRPPCAVCGGVGVVVELIDVDGPRWLDLCWPHARTLKPPPDDVVDAVAVLREAMEYAAAVTGVRVPVQIWTDEGGWQHEQP